MTTALRIAGAIDRHDPDPAAPHDPTRRLLGMVTVQWTNEDGPTERTAGILRVSTGRGDGDKLWGPSVLVLVWVGDPPPAEVAQAVYDRIQDGGPGKRTLRDQVVSQPRTEAAPSYRMARV